MNSTIVLPLETNRFQHFPTVRRYLSCVLFVYFRQRDKKRCVRIVLMVSGAFMLCLGSMPSKLPGRWPVQSGPPRKTIERIGKWWETTMKKCDRLGFIAAIYES